MFLTDSTNFNLDVTAGSNPCGGTAPAIYPGETCSVNVDFVPLVAGSLSTTLTIDSDDPDSPLVDVSMVGTAIDPLADTGSGGGGGGCSIFGVKMSISDALAVYGLPIFVGVLWGIRRRGKDE